MTKREDAVRSTYDAYNARDLPRALAAVARHWADQWRQADAKVEIEHLAWQGEELRLAVRLDVCKPDGSRAQQPLANTLSFAGELIRAMRIA